MVSPRLIPLMLLLGLLPTPILGYDKEDTPALSAATVGQKAEANQWYTIDEQLQATFLHVFTSLSRSYEPETMQLRTRTILELMRIQGIRSAGDVRRCTLPGYACRVLPMARKKNELRAALLCSKQNIAAIEKDYGKEKAAAFQAYCRKLQKTAESENPPDAETLAKKDMLRLLPLVIQGYSELPENAKSALDAEEAAYLQFVLERVGARLYLLQLGGQKIPQDCQRAIWQPCQNKSTAQLRQILQQTIKENGLPETLREVDTDKAARNWHSQL